jgi:hypothetical protein
MDQTHKLTREEFEQGLRASVECEASKAAGFMGSALICYGIVQRDDAGQLSWFNCAHPAFAPAVTRATTVAFVGIAKNGRAYVHMQYGQYEHRAEVKIVAQALAEVHPGKETLCFARLSRSEMARRLASGILADDRLISAAGRVPEYVENFYCYDTPEGWHVSWDEGSVSPLGPPLAQA